MDAHQFLIMIACMLCLALGAIAVNQFTLDAEPAPTVQVMEPLPASADATDGIRL